MLIFLIGFMGSGKSYMARNLSPLLNYDYIDMDLAIEAEENKTIREIFEQHGEDYFRKKEHAFIQELDMADNLIVSTGGGTPCFNENMNAMNAKGLTVYLNRSKEDIIMRLEKGKHKRPLIQHLTTEELSSFYDTKLQEREHFYKQAKIFAGVKTPEEVAELLANYIK